MFSPPTNFKQRPVSISPLNSRPIAFPMFSKRAPVRPPKSPLLSHLRLNAFSGGAQKSSRNGIFSPPTTRSNIHNTFRTKASSNMAHQTSRSRESHPHHFSSGNAHRWFSPPTMSVSSSKTRQPRIDFKGKFDELVKTIDSNDRKIVQRLADELAEENKRGVQFDEVYQKIRAVENSDADALTIMYSHKVYEAKDFKDEIREVTKEYKSGAMDPSREAARYERLAQKKKKAAILSKRNKILKR